jgi:hypothetical protein
VQMEEDPEAPVVGKALVLTPAMNIGNRRPE